MVEVYRLHEPQIAPYDGTPSLLDRLRVECVLGLVTDGFRSVQERKLDALRLGPYFQAVVFSDTLGRDAWKPSPRPFEAVLERLSVSGREAVYVADNPAKDFRGARCVGMATVRVRHADGLYHHLEASSPADAPDWEISQLGELETLLGVESARTGGRR
jgi:putative hydrolase of the HAD superfamily